MPSFREVSIGLLLALSLVSCNRDPNTAKKKYLESGNSYFEHGQYKYAEIQYQNAVKRDPKFGLAHYKLGEVYMKEDPQKVGQALKEYRKSIELLKDEQAYQEEYRLSLIKLAQLNLVYLPRDKIAMGEVQTYCNILLKKDPNSFEAYVLQGDLNFRQSESAMELTPSEGLKLRDAAMENYRKAESIKPNDGGVAMQIGEILVKQGHLAEAEPPFRKAIDGDKTSRNGYANLFAVYKAEGKLADAEQLLKEAIQNNPKNYEYQLNLAQFYGQTGRKDDMLSVLQQVKSHAKDFPNVYRYVGNFYFRMGDPEGALREYRDGMVKDEKNKATYQHAIVETLIREGKRAEAAEVNEQILKDNSKDPDARSLKATMLMEQGDINNALAQLQAVVTSSPDNAMAHLGLGRAYMASSRPDSREAARQQFEIAISLRKDLIQPRLGLAQLQVGHGEYQAALDTVREILARDPNNVNAKLIQSQAYLGQKKYGESETVMAGMMKTNSNSPDVLYQAGMNAMAQNKPDVAASDFMRAFELNPASSKSLLGLIDADFQMNKPDAAMNVLAAESKKSPNRIDLLFLMGTTADRAGKRDQALDAFNKVLTGMNKKDVARADVYLQIANIYREKGDRDAAVANCLKAREIKPDNEQILTDLGMLYAQAGRKTESRQAYEASLKVSPNNPRVLNELAYLLADMGTDLDMAMNYAQRAKGLVPNSPDISDTFAWILFKKGLVDQAQPLFKDLVARYPATSTYHYHLAMTYKQKGDVPKASEEVREALKHSPPPDEQQKIQELQSKLGK